MHFKISIITINKIQEKFDEIFNQRTAETLSRNLRATEFSNSSQVFFSSKGLLISTTLGDAHESTNKKTNNDDKAFTTLAY